jgi:hypothetical protein
MAQPTKNDRDLGRVVKLSSALGMGVMAGFIYSVKSVHPMIRFEFSFGVVLAALLVGAATWAFFAVIFRAEQRFAETASGGRKRHRAFLNRWMLLFVILTMVATIAAFARSLRGISDEKVREMIEGTVMAILFVSFFLYLLWRLLCFLEQDSERNARLIEEANEQEPSEP